MADDWEGGHTCPLCPLGLLELVCHLHALCDGQMTGSSILCCATLVAGLAPSSAWAWAWA